MKKKWPILLLVAVGLVGVAGYSAGWFRKDTGLESPGTVESRNIRVGSKIGGRIEKILVREGDNVEAGQGLITFDDKELQAALSESRAAAEKSAHGFRAEEIAEARAAATAAKAEYEQRKNGYRQED